MNISAKMDDIKQEDIRKVFGSRLSILRKGLDAERLSALILPFAKTTESQRWANWEKGSNEPFPAFEVLVKISQFFHVSTDWLLGITDDPTPSKEVMSHATQSTRE